MPPDLARSFPERLQQSRAARGYSVTDLARAAGVTHPSVLGWESGAVEPKIGTVERIASALGVDPRWLAYG